MIADTTILAGLRSATSQAKTRDRELRQTKAGKAGTCTTTNADPAPDKIARGGVCPQCREPDDSASELNERQEGLGKLVVAHGYASEWPDAIIVNGGEKPRQSGAEKRRSTWL